MFHPFVLSAPLAPVRLHVPDGFLSTPVALVGWALAVLTIAYALRQTRRQLGERQVPLLGVMAAFIFAAQTINFPVAGGTSGHLLGGEPSGGAAPYPTPDRIRRPPLPGQGDGGTR